MPLRLFFPIICTFFATCLFAVAAGGEGSGISTPHRNIPGDIPATGIPAPADSESNRTLWKLLNTEKRTAIVKHNLDGNVFREGESSEHLFMIFPQKTDLFFGREIDFPCVIEELSPSVWVKSNQPGLVLGAQIVLPNEINPNTGRPITFLIAGSRYADVGDWQELKFANPNLHQSASQTVRNLRGELEYKLDLGNMYVRQLILYVEGLPYPTNRPSERHVWIDQLQVSGAVPIWGILGKESKEFGRLEPENAAYLYELDLLEQKEYGETLTSREREEADEPEKPPVYPIHRIEIVGGSPPTGPVKTVEDHICRGFRPKFDPINVSGFLTQAVSEPVFSEYTTEIYDSGKIVWDASTVSGRNLDDPYNIKLREKLNDTGKFRLDPTRSSHLLGYEERRGQAPNHADTTETVYYTGGALENASSPTPVQTVRLEGQMIRLYDSVGKKSLGIRAIEYRGESLEFLYRMGFNTIWLSTPPSRELLEEAMRKRLWIICPPPPEIGVERPEIQGSSTFDRIAPTPPEYQNVLCWNLGEYLVKPSVSEVDLLSKKIKAADRNARQAGRPFICSIESGGLDFSRQISDLIVLMRRDPLLTSLDLTEYGQWLRDYEKKLQRSTPRWAAIQTQPDANLVAQWDLFGGHREQPVVVSFDQIRLMVRQALAAGSHGILFTSQTPLTDQNPETEYRVKALALMNMELMLIEEWFAEGTVSGFYESNHPQLSGFLLYLDKARLFLPLWNEPNSQYAMGQAAVKSAVFKIPVPETYDKLFLTPGVFERVPSERVAGGTELRINDASMNSLIFMTENGSFRGKIEMRAKLFGETMSRLALDLAKMRVESDEKTFQMLKQASDSKTIPVWPNDNMLLVNIYEQETLFNMTKRDIELGEHLFQGRDYSPAYLQAELATRGIRAAERQMWHDAARVDINRSLTPVSTGFTTIPFYVSMYNNFRSATQGPEMLLYGDFESPLESWKGGGWRHEQHQWGKDITSSASFLTDNPRPGSPGNRSLRLLVQSENNVPLETAPIWITTPGISVSTGQLLCVSGWINIPERLKGTADGLIIWDSIGGDPLALRFYQTDGWRQFVFFRYAPSDGLFEVRFYLSGVGRAMLDDISVRPVVFGTVPDVPLPRPVPTPTPGNRWGLDRLDPRQYFPWRQQQQP
ncbi:MAG: hypothetical protein FWC43_10220 [Planctomycetaceae bacterium]|nr:hypothetical protein [Planctomycetaceae bacterium]